MEIVSPEIDRRLMDGWQRDLPLASRPFEAIGQALGLREDEVIARLARLREGGKISRVGGTCRPNTAGASTLAAVAATDGRIESVAAAISNLDGVNHSYLRENAWNIWFVATGPDRAHVDATLEAVRRRTALEVLDLPLVRSFNVDLGFRLDGAAPAPRAREADIGTLLDGDRPILQALSEGLDIVARPYAALARSLGRDEAEIIGRIGALLEAGLIGRLGVIVRHRSLGWTSNAMVVWEVPEDRIVAAGETLRAAPGVTLCYQRRPAARFWPYNLYCMIHARGRDEALETLQRAEAAAMLGALPRRILFSIRCFKQKGALVAVREGAAA